MNGPLINATYLLVNSNCRKEDYLLQRVNPNIFGERTMLMKNISSVMNYLYLNQEPFRFSAMNLIETKEGDFYYRDSKGNYWRMIELISKQMREEITGKPEDAYQWACFLGEFLANMDAFPVKSPGEIAFNRRATKKKLKAFGQSLDAVKLRLKSEPKDEIEYVFECIRRAKAMDQWLATKSALALSAEGSLARAM